LGLYGFFNPDLRQYRIKSSLFASRNPDFCLWEMIFSILQVSRDHKRLLTAFLRHLFSVVYCNKVTVLKQWSLTAAHVGDHRTAVICFVQKRWLTGFTATLVVTYSETDSVKFKDATV